MVKREQVQVSRRDFLKKSTGLAALILSGGCKSAYHEVFRNDNARNMTPFSSSIEPDYSQYNKEKRHTTVINGRAYTDNDVKPAITMEEIVELPPGKVYKIPALKAEFMKSGGEITLKYRSRIPATDLQKRFTNVEYFKDFKMSAFSNRLFFIGKEEAFDFVKFRDYFNFFDVPAEQVRVAVSVIEHFKDNTYDREWFMSALRGNVDLFILNLPSNPDPTKTLGAGIKINPFYNYNSHKYNVAGALSFLNSHGRAEVASHTDVIVSNGGIADLSSIANIPYEELLESKTGFIKTVKYRDTGTKIKITPNANEEGYISLSLEVETGEQTGFATKEQFPVFKTSTYKTTVDLRNGETEFVGVSSTDRFDNVDRGLPGFDRLPIIRDIISSKELEKSKSELIYILTARVLDREDNVKFKIIDSTIVPRNSSHNYHDSKLKKSGKSLLFR